MNESKLLKDLDKIDKLKDSGKITQSEHDYRSKRVVSKFIKAVCK